MLQLYPLAAVKGSDLIWYILTLSLKRNFSSWIFPGTQGQGHVTLDDGKSAYRFSMGFLASCYHEHCLEYVGLCSKLSLLLQWGHEKFLIQSCVSFDHYCTLEITIDQTRCYPEVTKKGNKHQNNLIQFSKIIQN